MAEKFIELVSGQKKENEGLQSSAGVGDAGKIPALDATGRLNSNMMPVGVAPETVVCPSYENLVTGNYVNLFSDSGTLKARKSDAGTNKYKADGFVLANYTAPANATVYIEGNNTGCAGMTIGAVQFLSETPGARTETPVSGTGKINQILGKAISATEMTFEPEETIELA